MRYIALILLFLTSVSCLDPYEVPYDNPKEYLVVDGLLTNVPEHCFVKLSYTFYKGNTKDQKKAEGVIVKVIDTKGNSFILSPVPDLPGLYLPISNKLTIDSTLGYKLQCTLPNGKIYESSFQKLPPEVPIGDLEFKFLKTPAYGYQVRVVFQDPKIEGNFYRWQSEGYHPRVSFGQSCCTICNVFQKSASTVMENDKLFNGLNVRGIRVFFSPFYYVGNHYVKVTQYTIHQNTFVFNQNVKAQKDRTGSIFDAIPGSIKGNIQNINDPSDIGLGFFEVSSESSFKKIIYGDTLSKYNLVFDNQFFRPNGDCMNVFPNSVYINQPLIGW